MLSSTLPSVSDRESTNSHRVCYSIKHRKRVKTFTQKKNHQKFKPNQARSPIKVKPSCSKSRSRDKFPSKGSIGQVDQGFLDESVRRQVLDLQDCTLFLPFFHNYEDPSFYRSLGLVFVFQFFAAYFGLDRRNHR